MPLLKTVWKKGEKPFQKWADFLKVEKFDLFKKTFQGPTDPKSELILKFYASICS